MDKITIERIQTIHPDLRVQLLADYIACNNLLPKGVRLRFTSVFRTVDEQNVLFKKRPKVTQAKGGQSIHNYGLAFDMVILIDKDGDGKFEAVSWSIDEHWITVVQFFKAKGWEWGGDWKKFKDAPHFQKAVSLGWNELKRRVDSGLSIKDGGIVYPLLKIKATN